MTRIRVWVCWGLSAALAGCSGDDHAPPVAGAPLPECPHESYATCDVRRTPCQEQLLALAGCTYGVKTTPQIPVRVVDEQQLIDDLNAKPADEGTDEASAAYEADLPHIERALTDLKLLQIGDLTEGGGSTAQIVDEIDGVYQDAERGIALVDRGVPQDTAEADALLVHEFVHAIQDAQFGLEAWRTQYASSIDTVLALRTVSEGQATYAQFRALLALSGRDVAGIDWPRTLDDFRDHVLDDAFTAASPYLASITTFPYAYGARSAYFAWDDHRAQFDAPPQTTLEVLRLDAGIAAPPPDAFDVDAPSADGDYRLVDGDTLGAFQLELSARKLGADETDALALALAWRGDALWIYAGPDDKTVWVWMVELGGSQYARALAALAPGSPGFEGTASGKRVVLIGGDERPDWLDDASLPFLMSESAP